MSLSPSQQAALDACHNSLVRIMLITGEAGSGKSYVVKRFREESALNIGVVAPTGVAAIHIEGSTIASYFKLPPHIKSVEQLRSWKPNQDTKNKLCTLDVLLIDEISMVHYNTIKLIDHLLKFIRKKYVAFGGVKLITVGDYYQLPPIQLITDAVTGGNALYAFEYEPLNNALVYRLVDPHRQKNATFLSYLNQVRVGKFPGDDVFLKASGDEKDNEYTRLYATNIAKDSWNTRQLNQLSGPSWFYSATVQINTPIDESELKTYFSIIPKKLELKCGAYVMCIKNKYTFGVVNGDTGVIEQLDDTSVTVRMTRTNAVLKYTPDTWTHCDSTGRPQITITQIPLVTAWAATVHKAQGLSLDRVIIDFNKVFTPGQAYTALSRCRDITGLRVINFTKNCIKCSPIVKQYYQDRVF